MKFATGIDISKDSFYVCIKQQLENGRVKIVKSTTFSNNHKGFRAYLQYVRSVSDEIFHVMEATGSYYEELAYFLHDNEEKVSVILANKIKHYAKSLNVKTKTDKVDASVIASFGLERSLPVWQPMNPQYRQLRDLCRELLSVKQCLAKSKCQLHALNYSHQKNPKVVSLKNQQIQFYENLIEELEVAIKEIVANDEDLHQKIKNIEKVKGLRMITIVTVLCETNGFELFENIKQVVSYAGLDVVESQSGLFRGKTRISKKGNSRIRQALYMPGLSASQHNKAIHALHFRICEKNPQTKRKGIIAAMRKLLILIYVLWTKNEPYREDYQWNKNQISEKTNSDIAID